MKTAHRADSWLIRVSRVWRSMGLSTPRKAARQRLRSNLDALECRCLLSATLLADTFHTNANPQGGGWNDVNHGLAARQSGSVAPVSYVESIATGAGGNLDQLTRVNNPALPNTLRLATEPSANQTFTFVSLDRDFAADGLSMQHLHVDIAPLGPRSGSAADHWAAVVFGAAPGSFVISPGTGVLVRANGEYELWSNNTELTSGFVTAKPAGQSYAIDFAINPASGQFTLSIGGKAIFTSTHGAYSTNYVTLEDFTGSGEAGVQADYFGDLVVNGTAAPQIVAKPNTTYYVSPTGNDQNAGTSPTTAWRTINHVNSVEFRAGDRILFEGGNTFSGNLVLDSQDIGPITVGSYGNGPATINAGKGTGILVSDTSHITIADLDLFGSGFATNTGDGIDFTSDLPGVAQTGLSVSDVSVSGFGQTGVNFLGSNGSRDFQNVSVTFVTANNNGNGGLQLQGQGQARDVYIGHVQAIHNAGSADIDSGYGILVFGANDVVIERSVTGDNGWLPGNHGETGGIEAIADNRVLLQYNEAYSNHAGNSDGDGIILDVTNDSIMQFNYSHDNDGAGLFLFAETGATSTNNIIRYNISQNDARTQQNTYGGIFVGADVNNTEIYNNTVFMGPSPTSSPAAIRLLGLLGSTIDVRNNIFESTGGVPAVFWDGSGTGNLFQGNDYWSGKSPLTIDWNGVTYNTLQSWRAATGQETVHGLPSGLNVQPGLTDAGGGGTIGNADRLITLTAYELEPNSPLADAGLDLGAFGQTWDPYQFGDDGFIDRFFADTATDFYENLLPFAGPFSIGANQASTSS
jgi:Right handed beta helix region